MSFWDQHQPKTGEFYRFDTPGQRLRFKITAQRSQLFTGDTDPTPILDGVSETGQEVSVAAGSYRLFNLIATERPEVGDIVTIVFTHTEGQAKHWSVTVEKAGAPAVAAPAAVQVAAAQPAFQQAPVAPAAAPMAPPIGTYVPPATPPSAPFEPF